MKGLFLVLVLTSQLLFSQNNIAIFHSQTNAVALPASSSTSITVAPFNIVNGMVIVKASVDGVLGNFILDTGAPRLVLNANQFPHTNHILGTGIAGDIEMGEVELKEFKWGGIEYFEIKAFTLDISHLEESVGRNLMGLIGFDLLKDQELFFDFPNDIIKIYSSELSNSARLDNHAIETPFILNGHVPTIAAKVNNKKVFLGIDSGAGVNLFDEAYFSKNGMKEIQKEIIIGLDQNPQTVNSAIASSFTIKNSGFDNLRCYFMDMTLLKSQFESRLDGVLGYPFLKEHAVAINFKEQKVYIWD